MSDEKKQDSYFSAMIKFKIISTVFSIVIILAVVAFFTTGVSSEKIFKAYNSLNTTNGSNMNSLKKLNFLASYIKETGDLSILTKVGLASTEEEAKEILAEIEDNLNPTEEDDTQTKQTITISSLTKEEWEKALAAKNHPYYKLGSGIKTISLPTGETFIYEVQGGAWNGVTRREKNDEGEWFNNAYITNLACFEFAQSAAITALRKELVTMEDVLKLDGVGNLRWENNKWVDSEGKFKLGCYGGEQDNRPFTKYNINFVQMSNWNNGKVDGTIKDLYNYLKKEGFDDCVYIVYFHTKHTCGGYCHWMCVYGIDNNGGIYVSNNNTRMNPIDSNIDHEGPKTNSKGLKASNEVTSIYKVTRK